MTSIAREAAWSGARAEPSTDSVERAASLFADAFRERLAAAAHGAASPALAAATA